MHKVYICMSMYRIVMRREFLVVQTLSLPPFIPFLPSLPPSTHNWYVSSVQYCAGVCAPPAGFLHAGVHAVALETHWHDVAFTVVSLPIRDNLGIACVCMCVCMCVHVRVCMCVCVCACVCV